MPLLPQAALLQADRPCDRVTEFCCSFQYGRRRYQDERRPDVGGVRYRRILYAYQSGVPVPRPRSQALRENSSTTYKRGGWSTRCWMGNLAGGQFAAQPRTYFIRVGLTVTVRYILPRRVSYNQGAMACSAPQFGTVFVRSLTLVWSSSGPY